jgi:hypothetical protein
MPTGKLTKEIIDAAIQGFEEQKRQIDTKVAELRAMLPGDSVEPAATPEAPKRTRRKMSAAGRKAIAEAQRKRWADSKKAAASSAPEAAPKKKRKLSKAGRAAIVAATKKRWEAVHKAQNAAAKKAPPKKKMSAARKAALVLNLQKARAATAAKRAAA